ncbi:hypothetical protein D3C75_880040 [compost metagenome]
MAHCIKQGEGSDGGHGQRNDDAGKNVQIVGAVHLGGFLQTVRKLLEKVFNDDQIECVDSPRDDDGPVCVHHAQLFDQNKGRNHAAVKHHGEQHQEHDAVTADQRFVGQRVGHQRGHGNIHEGARQCDENGHSHAAQDGIGA